MRSQLCRDPLRSAEDDVFWEDILRRRGMQSFGKREMKHIIVYGSFVNGKFGHIGLINKEPGKWHKVL